VSAALEGVGTTRVPLQRIIQSFSKLLIREGTMKHPEKVKNQDEKV